jgi:hypothetical protein
MLGGAAAEQQRYAQLPIHRSTSLAAVKYYVRSSPAGQRYASHSGEILFAEAPLRPPTSAGSDPIFQDHCVHALRMRLSRVHRRREPGIASIIAVIASRRENHEQGRFQRSTAFEINARGRATLNKASADHPDRRLPPSAHCSAIDCFTPLDEIAAR